jgi:PKD repeat protein
MTGQSISLDGGGSWCEQGWITGYYWDFGDGTSGSGPNPNHQYNADGVYSVTLSVSDSEGNWASSQSFVTVNSVFLPVRLTFDELPDNTVVADQYNAPFGVRFSSGNFFLPVHTQQFCGFFCSATSLPNFITTKPDDFGQVTVEFAQRASNLSFFIVGVDTLFGTFGRVDIYRNGAFSSTMMINGAFNKTVGVTFGSTTDITKIIIYGLTDPAGVGFDDFTFTIPADIKITNPRVSGSLNGTTQSALPGADITLNANPTPAAFAGGSYSWSFTGPVSISGGSMSSSSVVIKSIDAGTLTARVNYTKNGLTVSASVTINAVLPSLTNFTAQQGSDLVSSPGQCISDSFWWYKLGCVLTGQIAMNFTSSVHAPTFISDPSQSGIKYVQAVSAFRKENRVGLRCDTKRSSESNIGSGWQLDTQDPYIFPEFPVHRFSEGNDLTMLTVDYPKNRLTAISAPEFTDTLYVDDRFEMYVVYFTGDPASPPLQRPLGKLVWNWGGLVVLDWNGTDAIHNLRLTNAPPGTRTGVPATSMVTMQGNVNLNSDVPCPGGPPLTNNNIDSSRVFVKYHYLDFLGRNPAGDPTHPPDLAGWNFWTSGISQCVFDLNCIHAKRVSTGLAFFYSGEFIQTDPDMANPPGSPGFNAAVYNRRFVYWCYQKYLHRDPTGDSGWDFWTNILNSTGDYGQIINAFQLSGDYRDRPFS